MDGQITPVHLIQPLYKHLMGWPVRPCMYVCMYVCVYCTYMYVCMHTVMCKGVCIITQFIVSVISSDIVN